MRVVAGQQGILQDPIERIALTVAVEPLPREALADAILARRPTFLAHRWADLAKMREALRARDFKAIQTLGHNCKGTGAGYGFPALGELGATIETAARIGDAASLEESFRQFESRVRVESSTIGMVLEA